jgi:hypothetical protein
VTGEGNTPIEIRVTGPEADRELRSLYGWLCEDPDIRRHARLSLVAGEPDPGQMGAALEVIQFVVDSGFQAASLAVAYATWRATRPNPPRATITNDDTTLALDDADEDSIEVIIRVRR